MKISELKPCACCRGKLVPTWYVLRFSQAWLNPEAASAVLGTAQILGGLKALGIAEAMAPDAGNAVTVAMDKKPELMTELHICERCYLSGVQVDLARLVEAARGAESAEG